MFVIISIIGAVLIVITEKEKIGDIYGTEIFKVKKVGIYPNTKNDSRLTQSQVCKIEK